MPLVAGAFRDDVTFCMVEKLVSAVTDNFFNGYYISLAIYDFYHVLCFEHKDRFFFIAWCFIAIF